MGDSNRANPAFAPGGARLLDRVRETIRRRHYSYRTEQTHVHWIERFIYLSGKRHPRDPGELALKITAPPVRKRAGHLELLSSEIG